MPQNRYCSQDWPFAPHPAADARKAGQDDLAQAGESLEHFNEEAKKSQFDVDLLCMALDSDSVARYISQKRQSEKAKHIAKVMWLKKQNAIGVSQVKAFLGKRVVHHLVEDSVKIEAQYDGWRRTVFNEAQKQQQQPQDTATVVLRERERERERACQKIRTYAVTEYDAEARNIRKRPPKNHNTLSRLQV